MEAMEELLRTHGYALLLVVGFAEFAGLPLASGPVLVLAGAFAARGAMELHWAIAAAVGGALIADLCWYGMARRYGGWVLGVACGLSSYSRVVLLGGGGLILGAIVWRVVKIGMHRRRHPASSESKPDAVAA